MRPRPWFAALAFLIALGAAEARAGGCPNIVGVWNSWASGLFGQGDTTFNSDGTVVHRSGNSGVWKCEGGKIVMTWGIGAPELYTVEDNKIINAAGIVGFSREPGTPSPPAATVAQQERTTPRRKPQLAAPRKPRIPVERKDNTAIERATRALGL
ncbi:MAG: hypothetical protein ABSC22_19105 [Roseiarcus sp.]|jgi:hypothetical protein